MDDDSREKIKLTVREILLNFLDLAVELKYIFDYGSYPKKDIREYRNWRALNQDRYYQTLWRLEKQGYLKRYQKGSEQKIKLTKLGEKKALKYLSGELKLKLPKTWDKKWRIAIFDIPEDKKNIREIVRDKLKLLGFYQLQKSVFVYPFEIQELISYLKYTYSLGKYLQYITAEDIETQADLFSYFYEKGLLDKKILRNANL